MRLDPLEVKILKHRLDAPDCIAEAMTDRGDDEEPCQYSFDDVYESAEGLCDLLPVLPDNPTPIQCDVLWDSCDGSTFLACSSDGYDNGDISRHELSAIRKAARTLEQKISRLIGRSVSVSRD